jgi:3-isopropylmalate/(R)-2-methylmalate dehydratase small subunit
MSAGEDTITGRIWCFGEHVNTDVIHPPDFFSLEPEKVKDGLFQKYDPTLQPRLLPGDILVGGRNFGCGSSRETSIRSIKLNRIGAIVAVDFARIFFRSATNNGVPCLTFRNAADYGRLWQSEVKRPVEPGPMARISLASWTLHLDTGDELELTPAPDFIVRIWRAGGLLETLLPSDVLGST